MQLPQGKQYLISLLTVDLGPLRIMSLLKHLFILSYFWKKGKSSSVSLSILMLKMFTKNPLYEGENHFGLLALTKRLNMSVLLKVETDVCSQRN